MDVKSGNARPEKRKEKFVYIKNAAGDVLWSGQARSWRAAVVAAVREGANLAGADLRAINLSRLDLTGALLSGALLDGADLRGCILRNAVLDNASMCNVKAQGATFDVARMQGARIEDSDFTGSSLVFSDMRHCRILRSVFESVSAASCRLSGSMQKDSRWDLSDMSNAEFMDSEIIECDFLGTNLGHRAFTTLPKEERERLSKHLPNRTAGAKVVGCTYDKHTTLSDTVPAMMADKRSTSLTQAGLWAASTLGVVTGVDKAFEVASELGHSMGMHDLAAWGVIVAISTATLLRETVVERLREKASEKMSTFINTVRHHTADMIGKGAHTLDLMVLVGGKKSLEPIRMALSAREMDARRAGFWSVFTTFATGMGKVVLCDRKHLAMAMSTLCAAREKGFRLKEEMTLLHCADGCTGSLSPCAMHLGMDGTTTATWRLKSGDYAVASYARDGSLRAVVDATGGEISVNKLPEHARDKASAMLSFEAAILETHGMEDFHYDKNSHRLLEGRKGAMLVKRRSNGRISNVDGQPAIIPLEGESVFVNNGSVYAP